jgi:hypothetical protein
MRKEEVLSSTKHALDDAQQDIIDRLNPRDTFYGGRTNAIKLFHEIQQPQPGETMEYYDFTRYVCVFCT